MPGVLTVRDLPGVVRAEDTEAAGMVRRGVRGTRPVVAFDAECTDGGRADDALLSDVLEGVRDAGQCWSDAVFVPNRVDAFARDGHRPTDRADRLAHVARRRHGSPRCSTCPTRRKSWSTRCRPSRRCRGRSSAARGGGCPRPIGHTF